VVKSDMEILVKLDLIGETCRSGPRRLSSN
jgi:hypothetical protein